MRRADRSFVSSPETVREARQFAVETADRWHIRSEDLPLVVTELVTNAVVHAGAGYSLELSNEADTIMVKVEDDSGQQPVARRLPENEPRGRGLPIIEVLAREWGAYRRADGKVVWARLAAEDSGQDRVGSG